MNSLNLVVCNVEFNEFCQVVQVSDCFKVIMIDNKSFEVRKFFRYISYKMDVVV